MTSPTRTSSGLLRDESGAMAVVTVVFAVFLVGMLYYLLGIGQALLYRERMQDAADAAAHASAVMHARGMNLVALINVIMAALLAVLVALKLVSVLVTIAIGALVALSWIAPGAMVAVVSLNELRSAVQSAHEAADAAVQPALAILHTTATVVSTATPLAATSLATDIVATHYSPPAQVGFAVPASITLPLQSDSYATLCGKSARFVADFTLHPLKVALGGPGKVVLGAIKDAVEEMAEGAPEWFCEGADASLTVKTKESWPRLPSQVSCLNAVDDVNAVEAACEQAANDTDLARPDPTTGECTGLCQRDLYLAQAEQARQDCDPNKHGRRRDYVYQVRSSLFAPVGTGSSRHWRQEHTELALRKTDDAPCLPIPLDGIEWHRRMFDDDGLPVAVCTLRSKERDDGRVEIIDIPNVFGCTQSVTQKPPLGEVGADVPKEAEGDSKAPMQLADGATLGSEAFQVRAVVIGRPGGDVARRIVRLASFHHSVNRPELPGDAVLRRFALAQAEFYFDAENAEPDAALWEQRWKARLRRFRPSETEERAAANYSTAVPTSGEAPVTLESACTLASAAFTDLGPICAGLTTYVKDASQWFAH